MWAVIGPCTHHTGLDQPHRASYGLKKDTERTASSGRSGRLPSVRLVFALDGIHPGGQRKPCQEEGGRSFAQQMKQKALEECNHYSAKYAECAVGRTISVVWYCRKQAKELNECLHQYTNDSVLKQMKKNYMLEQERKDRSQL